MNNPPIPLARPSIGERELANVVDAVKSSWVSSIGKYVTEIETGFADFCGTKYCVALMNGTAAIHLALATLRIKEGDEVIVPSLTFIATANAVRYCGAVPVFVDSDPNYWCMDPKAVDAAITPRTRAIIAVHIYGHPADMDSLKIIAEKHKIAIIEDAAEAHGAEINGKRVGGLADFGAFSFYGNKIITTGEGGALTTNSEVLARRAIYLKDHGMSTERRYWHEEIGYNYRMTNLQAAIGVAQLQRVHELLAEKQEYLRIYKELLEKVPGVCLNPEMKWAKAIPWLICLDLRKHKPSVTDRVKSALKENNIDFRPFFIPMHKQPPYKNCKTVGIAGSACPVSEALAEGCVNLPSGYDLHEADIARVCEVLRKTIA